MKIDLKAIQQFPTLPGVAYEVMRLSLDPDVSIPKMAEVILKDVALTTRILKTINSPYYPVTRTITNISDALVLLGLQTVKSITLSLSVMDSFRGHMDLNVYSVLQTRALSTAVAARAVAEDCLLISSEDAFLVGLLEELGLLLLAHAAPKEFADCLDEARKHGIDVTIVLQESLGVDHAQLGLQLAENWGLAESIKDTIRYHKDPDAARKAGIPDERFRYIVVAYLGHIAASIFYGIGSNQRILQFRQGYRQYLGKEISEAENILHDLGDLLSRAAASFNIAMPAFRSYALILQEANVELGRINLQYEQLYRALTAKANELESAYKQLNVLTEELNRKNQILTELAARDGLTDLYNHRYFQEFMGQNFREAKRYGRSLSIIMMDIDHFKEVNDKFGHQFGDLLLKELAGLLRSAVRKADIIARYGGEEFAIIMPETNVHGAAAAAEKIRRMVQHHRVHITPDKTVGITLSLGVAQLSPEMSEVGELVGAADSSLYQAKRGGRNRVHVFE